MATFEQIKELRLDISDPINVVDLKEVASLSALPADPQSQTAYKVTSSGSYYETDVESSAQTSDYNISIIRISDTRLSYWLDNYTYTETKILALKAIISRLGSEYSFVRSQSGAELTEFNRIKDMLDYYKDLLSMAQEENKEDNGTNTGQYAASTQPEIGGGNL